MAHITKFYNSLCYLYEALVVYYSDFALVVSVDGIPMASSFVI